MPFEPLKFAKLGSTSLTLDKFHRLRLSSAALTELKLSAYQYVVLSVDVENRRIGVARQELAKVPNASAIKVDKRGYLGVAVGKQIASKLALKADELPAKFEYVGFVDENGIRWSGFELADQR